MTAGTALLGGSALRCRRAITGEHGIRLPPFVDHHVHLHLVDDSALAAHGIAGVVDLGGDPAALARRPKGGMPRLAYAGAFLTAPRGYPVGRSWAPPSTWREVTSPSLRPGAPHGAETAVDEQVAFGASVVKVALNADAGPVVDDDVLAAIVARAHAHGLPVVAHVQGERMPARALDAGVDVLAHAPFTERLDDETVRRAAATQAWISTLAIHSGAALTIAVANLAAFARAGGRVLYGTDLGNGRLPVGVNTDELTGLARAGLSPSAMVDALTDPWPAHERDDAVATFVPGEVPDAVTALPRWLAGAVVVPAEELVADEH